MGKYDYTVQNGYVIYERGKNNPVKYWQDVYKNAVKRGNKISPIFDSVSINTDVGDRLIQLGQNESKKEIELIESAGITINNVQDEIEFIRAFNETLQGKKNFENAILRINEALKIERQGRGARSPVAASWFSGYLSTSLNKVFGEFVRNNLKALQNQDFTEWEQQFEHLVDRAIDLAVKHMLTEMGKTKGDIMYGNPDMWKSYYDAYTSLNNISSDFKDMIKSKLELNKLIDIFKVTDDNGKPLIDLREKTKNRKIRSYIDSKEGLNLDNGKKSRGIAGSVQEFIQALGNMAGQALQNAADGTSKNIKGEIARSDTISIYNYENQIDCSGLAEDIANQIEDIYSNNKTIERAANELKKFYNNNLSKLNKTFIVYGSTKSYSLSSSFRGFHAGKVQRLETLPKILSEANVTQLSKAKDFIYQLYNTSQYSIYEGQRTELIEQGKKVIMSAVANLLFDDWVTIGEEEVSGARAIHSLDLDGVSIPLSVFLIGLGNAIKNTNETIEGWLKVSLHPLSSAVPEWAEPGRKLPFSGTTRAEQHESIKQFWTEQAKMARDQSTYSIVFLSNFKTMIKKWLDLKS